jgi:hypothetical protein
VKVPEELFRVEPDELASVVPFGPKMRMGLSSGVHFATELGCIVVNGA